MFLLQEVNTYKPVITSDLMYYSLIVILFVSLFTGLIGCNPKSSTDGSPSDSDTLAASIPAPSQPVQASPSHSPGDSSRALNPLGRIPILEYHLIGDTTGRWTRTPEEFRADLQLLYDCGYRPVTVSQVVDNEMKIPKGLSPVVIVFDDASPGQFSYVEQPDGSLQIDPRSAVGIWLQFGKQYSDWTNSAVFCMLPGGSSGHAFFGEKGIKGQKSAWRLQKVKFLADQGFELCNHTLWHANLGKYDAAMVQEQIARGDLAIDSAVPGYRVRTFALPLGVWPKQKELAYQGQWVDPKTGRVQKYSYDAVLEVSGGPTRSPEDPAFNARSMTRVQVYGNSLREMLDRLEKDGAGGRYVAR